jgi:hypothetical protein
MKLLNIVFAAMIITATASAVHGEQYRIQVRQTSLRSSASAFGPQLAILQFNTAVAIVGQKGGFYQITSPYGNGFVTKTAVVPQSAFDGQYVAVRNTGAYSQNAATAATKGFSDAEIQESRKAGARYDLMRQAMEFSNITRDQSWWASFRNSGFLGENRRMMENRGYKK